MCDGRVESVTSPGVYLAPGDVGEVVLWPVGEFGPGGKRRVLNQ